MPPLPNRKYLTRKEAAQYITETWFPCAPATLNGYATNGIGPKYSSRGANGGGETMYSRADIDDWAGTFLKPPAAELSKAAVQPMPARRGALSERP